MVMELPRSPESIVFVEVMVFGRMSVAGYRVEVGPPREQFEQFTTVLCGDTGRVRHIGLERRVHGQKDQPLVRNLSQFLLQPGKLPFAEIGDVATIAADIPRVGLAVTFVFDIVQHDEQRIRVLEGVVRWPEVSFESFQRVTIVVGFEVELMVTRHVVPGDADLGDESVQSWKTDMSS